MNIAYIVSSPYSGSTLLSFILNAHSEIGTISEYDVMEQIAANKDYLCSCGERLRECQFFLSVQRTLNDKGIEFQLDNMAMMYSLHPDEKINRYLTQKLPLVHSSVLESARDAIINRIPRYRRTKENAYNRNFRFMETVLELQNASVFLDANKNPYRLRFLNDRYPVKAIYLFKNGIAGVYSHLKASRHRAKVQGKKALSIEEACHVWFTEQITISRCLKHLPASNIMHVSYSELCSDPVTMVTQIHRFLDLEPHEFENFTEKEHHIIGNVMRTGNIESIKERTEWRDALTESDLETYRAILVTYEKKLARLNPRLLEALWR